MSLKTNKLPAYIKLHPKIRPQDNFYAYVCHHWCQANPRPATESRWSVYHKLSKQVQKQVQKIITDWLQNPQTLNIDQKKVVDYYQSLLHKEIYLEKSLESLKERLQKLSKCRTFAKARAQILAISNVWDVDNFLQLNVTLDHKNNQRYCLQLDVAELSLPNRDYYLSKTAKMSALREAYLDFLTKYQKEMRTLGLNYDLTPTRILEIETDLAKITWPLEKLRDLQLTYNLFSWHEFIAEFKFDWQTYFAEIGIKTPQDIIVSQPSFLKAALIYLDNLPLTDLEQYIIHKLALSCGTFLTEKTTRLQFQFFGRTLSGTQKLEPLKTRLIKSANHNFCDVIGQTYIERYFKPQDKQAVQTLAQQISRAFKNRLAQNTWMSEASKTLAQAKLERIIVNIGYSDFWQNYKILEINPQNPVQNYFQLTNFELKSELALLQKLPIRERFGEIDENIQNVNAWTYILLLNTSYPAGYLQAPFYDRQASWVYNLGALGSTIGHELTHNFDDQGSKYDLEGHLNPWLSLKEQKAFKKEAAKLIKTANQHYPAPKIRMKGKQVIGEIIADLGGLEITLDAVKQHYQNHQQRQEALKITFIAYAFSYAINESLESKIMLSKAGVHPDNPFRVNGVLAHCDDFYEVFNIQPTDNLYLKPTARAKIW